MSIEITTGIGGQLLHEEHIYKMYTGNTWTDEYKEERKKELINSGKTTYEIVNDNRDLKKYYVNNQFNVNAAIQDGVSIMDCMKEILGIYFQNQRKLEDSIKEL